MAARWTLAALVTGTVFLLACGSGGNTAADNAADLCRPGRQRPARPALDAGQIDLALHTPSLKQYDQPSQPTPIRRPAAVRQPSASGQADRPFPSAASISRSSEWSGPLLLLGASLGRLARVKPEGEMS